MRILAAIFLAFTFISAVGTNSNDYCKSSRSHDIPTVDSLLYWNSDYKLSWNDFQGPIDSLSSNKAVTTSNIGLQVKSYGDSIIVSIPACFYRYKSWSKIKSGSENLLNHEQLHFDIAELVARKMRQKFNGYTYSDVKSAYKKIQEIYDDYHGRVWDSYGIYDVETKHSIEIEKQIEWQNKIAIELKKLIDFSSSDVIIYKNKSQP